MRLVYPEGTRHLLRILERDTATRQDADSPSRMANETTKATEVAGDGRGCCPTMGENAADTHIHQAIDCLELADVGKLVEGHMEGHADGSDLPTVT